MRKKPKYDALSDPNISDEDIEKIELEASKTKSLSKSQFAKLLKKSKKGMLKEKPLKNIKKAA